MSKVVRANRSVQAFSCLLGSPAGNRRTEMLDICISVRFGQKKELNRQLGSGKKVQATEPLNRDLPPIRCFSTSRNSLYFCRKKRSNPRGICHSAWLLSIVLMGMENESFRRFPWRMLFLVTPACVLGVSCTRGGFSLSVSCLLGRKKKTRHLNRTETKSQS